VYHWLDQRLFLPRFDRVICVSQDLLNDCRSWGVPAERLHLVENGIDTHQYARQLSAIEAKRRLGFPENRVLIGAVGRLVSVKAFDLLIRAVGKLIAAGRDLQLIIAGEGPERDRLQKVIDQEQFSDQISLLGHRSDIFELYHAMDVYALSSIREGLPNAALEAMALETPVIATRVGGLPRLIQDGVSGLLVEPNSEDALAAGLDRMVRSQSLRESLAVAGRRTIEDRYSFARRIEKISAIYEDLLQGFSKSAIRTAASSGYGPSR